MSLAKPFIFRATLPETDRAFALVQQYYEEVGVLARDNRAEFIQQYFREGAGVWLASVGGQAIGCVALRKLVALVDCGEIKRMYVRSGYRGRGIVELLLLELTQYAKRSGYRWLYLDTTDRMVAARRFYERNGYHRCKRYNDNPQATIFMRKKIAGPDRSFTP